MLAAQRRGDDDAQVRSFSYIGSRSSEILAAITAGRVQVPADVDQIHRSVDESIASYGISQMILSLLDGVGLTMFATGKDDPLGIRPTQESLEKATGGLAKILGAIDPQSATVDPATLGSALTNRSTSPFGPRYTATQIGSFSSRGEPAASTQPSLSSVIGTDIVDLTTYEGLARLMQILRTIYDFYPGALS